MKTALATTSLALIAALSTLAPSAPAVAEANRHGYVNYRNYDEGPESLAAFRAYHHNARFGAAVRSELLTNPTACKVAPRLRFLRLTIHAEPRSTYASPRIRRRSP